MITPIPDITNIGYIVLMVELVAVKNTDDVNNNSDAMSAVSPFSEYKTFASAFFRL